MGTQLELGAQEVVPKILRVVETDEANSFTEALKCVESYQTTKKGLELSGPFMLHETEKKSLAALSIAFRLNTRIQKIDFNKLEVDHELVAEAFRTGIANEYVTYLSFTHCEKASNERLMKKMCQGFQERSTALQLEFWYCSFEFMKLILEASYLKCFSLEIAEAECSGLERPLKRLFRGNLCYITLYDARGLKESTFLELARCVPTFPSLNELCFDGDIPVPALKCLHGSLKKVLMPGRVNVFKNVNFGNMEICEKLCFAYYRLLRHDVFYSFGVSFKEDVSTAVVKSITSSVANTKNLEKLYISDHFSPSTKFKNFKLQVGSGVFRSPFDVNPPTVRDDISEYCE